MLFQTEGIFSPAVFENPRRRRRRSSYSPMLPGYHQPIMDVSLPHQLVPKGRQGTFAATWAYSDADARRLKLGKPVYVKNGIKYYGVAAEFSNGLNAYEALNLFQQGLQKVKGQTPYVRIRDFRQARVGNRKVYLFIVAPA